MSRENTVSRQYYTATNSYPYLDHIVFILDRQRVYCFPVKDIIILTGGDPYPPVPAHHISEISCSQSVENLGRENHLRCQHGPVVPSQISLGDGLPCLSTFNTKLHGQGVFFSHRYHQFPDCPTYVLGISLIGESQIDPRR